jgi:hypothetical protein
MSSLRPCLTALLILVVVVPAAAQGAVAANQTPTPVPSTTSPGKPQSTLPAATQPLPAAQNAKGISKLVNLSGSVEDQTGALVPGAQVRIVSIGSERELKAVADAQGRFEFRELPTGQYRLTAEAPGFIYSKEYLQLTGDTSIRVELRIQATAQSVEVRGGRSAERLLNENNADATRIDDDLIRELPVSPGGQSLRDLIASFLSPAATGTNEISVIVDGMEGSGGLEGGLHADLSIPLFAIRRLVVNRNTYSAEYRRPGKARVEILTQDGSRRHVHGGLNFTFQDTILNASDPFVTQKPDTRREFLEGSLSGPISRKVTVFGAVEHERRSDSVLVNAVTPVGSFIANVLQPQRETGYMARMDVAPNKTHTFIFRYRGLQGTERNAGVGDFELPEHAFSADGRVDRLQATLSSLASATFANEVRFAFERDRGRVGALPTRPEVNVNGAFVGGSAQSFERSNRRSFELQDVVTYSKGGHVIRAGVRYRPRWVEITDASNFGGTFEFADLNSFRLGRPFQFRIRQGNPDISFTQNEADGFLNYDVPLKPYLNLTLGMRYEWQSAVGDDLNNFAPRIALAYSPDRQKTVIRVGAGVFYDRVPERILKSPLLSDGKRVRELITHDPSFPGVPSGPGFTVALPSIVTLSPELRVPYLIQASVAMERELWRNALLTLEYAHINANHLFRARDLNAPLPPAGTRPIPAFEQIVQAESTAFARNNALSVAFRGRIKRFFKGTANYVLSRTINNVGGKELNKGTFYLPADSFNLAAEIGRADFDRRHTFNFAGVFDLPWRFRIGGLFSAASGVPFDITTGNDDNGDAVDNDRPPGMTRNRGRGPGLVRLDFRFAKVFQLAHPFSQNSHGAELEFSVDAFNALNHANFKNFVGIVSSPFFGRPNSAQPGRRLQLNAKYSF